MLFADGTRGTAATAYYSLFTTTPNNVGQVGNYRTIEEAADAAEQYFSEQLEDEMRRIQTGEYYS